MTDQVPDQGAAQRAAQDSAMIPVPVIYEVLADDTLSRISAKVYGDANAWRRIFEANRDLLDSPDDLSLGMKLVIP
ncbi:LysM peptidoglycan-binding domain-containing protein [Thiohalocapsa marina]|uniref:LysM peptidoglycan-binding domain-containing protein n=2 Tax=Thiohalocapsa marina TaxID=424902 RepID=A0A5M8FIW5_9GAMM|nr:LysM peptidoglycan-binding domain-containing protein [Thiohalocapsa marina]